MEDENIIWREMSGRQSSPTNSVQEVEIAFPPVEPCQMKAYKSLYEELQDKCNPQKFMSPYNKEKVDMANRLYKQLLDTSESSTTALKEIRGQAIQQLGVQISTKKLYQKLLKYCNPENFMNPYDFEAVQKANEYYALVEEYRNDVGKLERLEGEIMRDVALRNYYHLEREKRERLRKAQEENEKDDGRKIIIGVVIILFVFMLLCLILQSYA